MQINNTAIPSSKEQNDNFFTSSEACYKIALEEYTYTMNRANKFENKIYILITFCSLYSAFILNIFDDFFNITFPNTIKQYVLVTAYIILFFIMCILYINILIKLIHSLKALDIKRYDSNHLLSENMYSKQTVVLYMLITKKYIECTNDNNLILTSAYEMSEKINLHLKFLVIITFILKFISYFL